MNIERLYRIQNVPLVGLKSSTGRSRPVSKQSHPGPGPGPEALPHSRNCVTHLLQCGDWVRARTHLTAFYTVIGEDASLLTKYKFIMECDKFLLKGSTSVFGKNIKTLLHSSSHRLLYVHCSHVMKCWRLLWQLLAGDDWTSCSRHACVFICSTMDATTSLENSKVLNMSCRIIFRSS